MEERVNNEKANVNRVAVTLAGIILRLTTFEAVIIFSQISVSWINVLRFNVLNFLSIFYPANDSRARKERYEQKSVSTFTTLILH